MWAVVYPRWILSNALVCVWTCSGIYIKCYVQSRERNQSTVKKVLLFSNTHKNSFNKQNSIRTLWTQSSTGLQAKFEQQFTKITYPEWGSSNWHRKLWREQSQKTVADSKEFVLSELLPTTSTEQNTRNQLSAVAGPGRFISFISVLFCNLL